MDSPKLTEGQVSRTRLTAQIIWRNVVRWRTAAAKAKAANSKNDDAEWTTLIDLTPLCVVPKKVRPLSKQHSTESRRLWESVTSRLFRKEYGEATRAKHVIEQRQKDEAAERKQRGLEFRLSPFLFLFFSRFMNDTRFRRFVPTYFEKDIQSGVPTVTQAGREALAEEVKVLRCHAALKYFGMAWASAQREAVKKEGNQIARHGEHHRWETGLPLVIPPASDSESPYPHPEMRLLIFEFLVLIIIKVRSITLLCSGRSAEWNMLY
jgi:hypothetical protein